MREIKFRFWNKEYNFMIPETYELHDLHNGPDLGTWREPEHGLKVECSMSGCEVMQYTGLKDQNGKEIYEGDIIAIMPSDHAGERIPPRVWVAKFGEYDNGEEYEDRVSGNGWYLESNDNYIRGIELVIYYLSNDDTVQIIGNIYENPELLEHSKK